MITVIEKLFSSDGFMPHGQCWLWSPGIVWLHVLSDSLIFLSYVSIPVSLVYFVRRRKDIPFNWMFFLYGTFIVTCGLTHLMEVWTTWYATFWLSGVVKAITALASVPTAIAMWLVIPKALAIPSPDQLQDANKKLQAANKELETFSYTVSHDLRAPLRAIQGFSQILVTEHTGQLDDEGKRVLGIIQKGANQMGQLIDDLLEFSRMGRTEFNNASINMKELANEIFEELRIAEPSRNVQFILNELPSVTGDRALMRQVFINLLSNALKFSKQKEQSVIEVGGKRDGARFLYYVRDNGVGFDMQFAGKLFGIFQRLHSPSKFEGTGIGLALVQKIIHRHNGEIWAESMPNEQTTFYFTLPANNEHYR